MPANTSLGVLDQVRRIVKRDLAPLAARIDLEGHYPEDVLRAIGAAGGLRLHLPSQQPPGQPAGACDVMAGIEVMAAAAEACLSTSFLLWCQDACSWYIESSDNATLRDTLLPRLATGELLGGTALSNPMKALAGIEPVQLTGRATAGGFRVRGQLPWVSNLGQGHVFGAVFRVEDPTPRDVMAIVPCDAEGLRISQSAHFVALEGTRTFALRFDDVLVPEDWVLADPAGPFLTRIRAGFVLMQTGLALGLVQGCIDIMHKADRSLGHVNQFLPARPPMFEDALTALRAEVQVLARTPWEPDREFFLRVAAARLRAGELSVEAAGAAMLHAGARGYLVRAPAQRRLRESYFVAILTPALKHLRKELAG